MKVISPFLKQPNLFLPTPPFLWEQSERYDWSNNNGSIDMKMDGSALQKKSSFKMKFLSPEVELYLFKSTVVSGLVPLVATWNCSTSCKNEYTRLLVLHLPFLLNLSLSKCDHLKSFLYILLW